MCDCVYIYMCLCYRRLDSNFRYSLLGVICIFLERGYDFLYRDN